MKNKNWPRWIYASAAKHFIDKANADSLKIFVEGQERTTSGSESFIEFRLDGPDTIELSKDYWQLDIEINILIFTLRDIADVYKDKKDIGLVLSYMVNTIPIYRYGNGPDDDDTFLECLHLKTDINEPVSTNQFGQIDPNNRIMQATVEGHYKMNLST